MGGYQNLATGRLNFNVLVQDAHEKLENLLHADLGTKALVWDDRLTRPVGLLADYSTLKKFGVTRMLSLTPSLPPITDVNTVVFLVKPDVHNMKLVADYIASVSQDRSGAGADRPALVLCFVPDRCVVCERLLEERTVLSALAHITALPIRLFALDSDVLTMQYPSWFREHTLEGDVTCYFRAAQALVEFQTKFGSIDTVYGKGQAAKKVYECMCRLSEESGPERATETGEVSTLILLDRSVDLLSVMATQLTYEGLIDEIFGISNNIVKLPVDQSEETTLSTEPKFKQHVLNSADEHYAEIRDKNFSAVGPSISKKAKHVTVQYENRELGNIGAMKNFVRHVLPALHSAKESISMHTNIAGRVKQWTEDRVFLDSLQVEQEFFNGIGTDKSHRYIEQLIARQAPLHRVLRLLSVQCWCAGGGSSGSSSATIAAAGGTSGSGGGVTSPATVTTTASSSTAGSSSAPVSARLRLLERHLSDILATYGYAHALTLDRARGAGLLRHPPFSFSSVARALQLVVHDVSEQQPDDIAYTYSGYAPISVRLAQLLARPADRTGATTDPLAVLPGPSVRVEPGQLSGAAAAAGAPQLSPPAAGRSTASSGRCSVTVVVFLGGVTFAELSALRFLSAQDDAPTEYVVITTDMINGTTLLESIAESNIS